MSMWLGVDVETTGLSHETDRITEVGAVLWCTKKKAPMMFYNSFVYLDDEIPEMITKLTGIDSEMVQSFGRDESEVIRGFMNLVAHADFIVAHNAPFDKGFIEAMYGRCAIAPPKQQWIDSSADVPYPDNIQTRKLVHLAAEHQFVNPFAHRAVTDVLTMLQVVNQYDSHLIEQSAGQPSVKMRANVTFEEKDKASGIGFRWDKPNKVWLKNVKLNQVEALRDRCSQLGFHISEWN